MGEINGWGWPAGVDLQVTADDPATATSPDITLTLPTNAEGSFLGSLAGLAPGWVITVANDGVVTKTHTVRNISITEIDPAADIVRGTADPSTEVRVAGDWSTPYVTTTADGSGKWVAALSGVYDIKPGWSQAVATQTDDDFDSTTVSQYAPGYQGIVVAWPDGDRVDGWGWPPGVDLTVTADDPATTESPDLTLTVPTNVSGFPEGYFNGSVPGLEPGWVITVATEGVVTKTLSVSRLSISEIDPATDIVRGTADPSARVGVAGDFSSPYVYVMADGSGTWVADLSGVSDLRLGWSQVVVKQEDKDWDFTSISQFVGTIALPQDTSLTTPSHGTATSGTPTVYNTDPLTVSTTGCSGGTAAATFTALDNPGYVQSIALGEAPPASGTYIGTFAAPSSVHGGASISIEITGCSPATAIAFNLYIDPSGIVRDTFGSPVVGVTVTLYASADPGGPFAAVPGGSTVMGPGNRVNPDLTDALGLFGWDVTAGFYKVRAEKPGCTAPGGGAFAETDVLTIPPPVMDLALVLDCRNGDTTPPKLHVPGNITKEATAPGGAIATYTVGATDRDHAAAQIATVCVSSPTSGLSSGSMFPLGKTTITCNAHDPAGNNAEPKSFTVKVKDTTKPAIGALGDITVNATGRFGAIVTYATPTATDIVDGTVTVTCKPASGSTFKIGTTSVTCKATDQAGNTATKHFTVKVLGADEQISALKKQVDGASELKNSSSARQLRSTLISDLGKALSHNQSTSCSAMSKFVSDVQANAAPHGPITVAHVTLWVSEANQIRSVLGC